MVTLMKILSRRQPRRGHIVRIHRFRRRAQPALRGTRVQISFFDVYT
jgi:hypothetical protein